MFSGEISGVYRAVNEDDYTVKKYPDFKSDIDGLWQVGAGLGFNLGEIASISLAAAMGSGPFTEVNNYTGEVTTSLPVDNDWWGVSGLATANLSDTVHAEVGLGYKHRETDGRSVALSAPFGNIKTSGIEWDTWAVLGGIYYTPVDQLTIGLEGEWYTTDAEASAKQNVEAGNKLNLENSSDNWSVDLVSVWRF